MASAIFEHQYYLTNELFLERGYQLLEYSDEYVFPIDGVHLLFYLPWSTEAMDIHTRLLKRFVASVKYIPCGQEKYVGHLLSAYFQIMLALPHRDLTMPFVDSRLPPHATGIPDQPLYEGVQQVMGCLVWCDYTFPHEKLVSHESLLFAVTECLIDPNQIIEYLRHTVEPSRLDSSTVPPGWHLFSSWKDKRRHIYDNERNNDFLQESALGAFVYVLQPIILDTNWRPAHAQFDHIFWLLHKNLPVVKPVKLRKNSSAYNRKLAERQKTTEWQNEQRNEQDREHLILSIMSQRACAPLNKILTYIADQKEDTHPVLDAFFPLAINNGAPPFTLPLFIALTQPPQSQRARMFIELLTHNHPDIMQFLIYIYFDVPCEEDSILRCSAWALDSFNALISKNKMIDTVELPVLFDE